VPAASPTTNIEIGSVANAGSGAISAPMIEPVAKMTVEFAPPSAVAAARRRTLPRSIAPDCVNAGSWRWPGAVLSEMAE
jgi:hypothetical protein